MQIGVPFVYRHTHYTSMTGREGQDGVCWWCGEAFESKRPRHCCTPDHTEQYNRHFDWNYASAWALKRVRVSKYAEDSPDFSHAFTPSNTGNYPPINGRHGFLYRCSECGGIFPKVEVHHIVRLEGEKRSWSILNVPCNLLVLCLADHNKTKKKFKAERQLALEVQDGHSR